MTTRSEEQQNAFTMLKSSVKWVLVCDNGDNTQLHYYGHTSPIETIGSLELGKAIVLHTMMTPIARVPPQPGLGVVKPIKGDSHE